MIKKGVLLHERGGGATALWAQPAVYSKCERTVHHLVAKEAVSNTVFEHHVTASFHFHFTGGRPPRDATILQMKQVFVSKGLYGATCSLAAVGMAVTFGFLVFNVKYRSHRSVLCVDSFNYLRRQGSLDLSVLFIRLSTVIVKNIRMNNQYDSNAGFNGNPDIVKHSWKYIYISYMEGSFLRRGILV